MPRHHFRRIVVVVAAVALFAILGLALVGQLDAANTDIVADFVEVLFQQFGAADEVGC